MGEAFFGGFHHAAGVFGDSRLACSELEWIYCGLGVGVGAISGRFKLVVCSKYGCGSKRWCQFLRPLNGNNSSLILSHTHICKSRTLGRTSGGLDCVPDQFPG